jgi:hypothetical protein
MRKFVVMVFAPLVLLTAATLSGPAAAINAKEALAGVGAGDDAVTHDSGAVSICKGGTFPGCKGGKAFYCPANQPCEPTQQFVKPKTGVTGIVPSGGLLDSNAGFSPQGPAGAGAPAAPRGASAPALR